MTKNHAVIVYCPLKMGGVLNVTRNIGNAMASKSSGVYMTSSLSETIRLVLNLKWRGKKVHGILSLKGGFLAPFFDSSIYILHGYPVRPYYSLLRRSVLNLIPRFINLFGGQTIAVSYLVRNVYQRIYGIKVDEVIYNGCDKDFFKKEDIPLVKHKVILYVGRLDSNKGIKELINAFIKFVKSFQDYNLIIAGDGPLKSELSKMASSHRNIKVLGSISENEKINFFHSSEIFISLNDFEPMGVVYVEAMLSGCKIIFPYSSGACDFIPSYYPHRRCDPSLVDDIYDKLVELAQDKSIATLNVNDKAIFDYNVISLKYSRFLDLPDDHPLKT